MSSKSLTQRHMLRAAAFGIAAAAALTMAPSAFADGGQSTVPATTIELIDATSSSIPALEVAGTSDSLTAEPSFSESADSESAAPAISVAEPTVIEIGTATSASLSAVVQTPVAVGGAVSADGVGAGALSAVDVVAVAGQSESEPTVIEIGEATSASLPVPPADADQAADPIVESAGMSSVASAAPMANGPQIQVSGTSASASTSAPSTTATMSVTDPSANASQLQVDQSPVDQAKNNKAPAASTQAPQPLPVAAVEPVSAFSHLGWAIPALAFGFLIFRMFRRSIRQH